MYIETLHQTPRVAIARAVLSAAECQSLIALGEPLIEQGLNSSGEVAGRTSQHTTLLASEHVNHPVVERLARRTALLLNLPVSHIEAMQLVRYHQGEQFPVSAAACVLSASCCCVRAACFVRAV